MSLQAFRCPSCNASLDHDDASAVTIRCPYCSTTIIVPEALRRPAGVPPAASPEAEMLAAIGKLLTEGKKIEGIKVYRQTFGVGLKEAKDAVEALQRGEAVEISTLPQGQMVARPSGSRAGCVIFALLLLVVALALGGLAFGFVIGEGWPAALSSLSESNEAVIDDALEAIDAPADLSILPALDGPDILLTIGGQEGSGPGFFQDTRWLGVDGAGNIYAADFDGGRVQVFDSEGNFITQWFTENRGAVHSLAVDRTGTAYVLESGAIHRYEGNSGRALGPLPAPDISFDDMVLTASGDLLALSDGRLVRFGPDGTLKGQIDALFAALPDDVATSSLRDMAVDGADNLYLLFVFEDAVYQFDDTGAYVDRFGQEGEGPGDFTSPTALAVDGRGRIFVEDFADILIFEPGGRFQERLHVGGAAFTILFDSSNQLYRMDRNGNRIVKYALSN